jgi:hypothetical protein
MTDLKQFTVGIHGKQYLTVAGRVQMAHDSGKFISIQTEVVTHEPYILVKATVTVAGRIATQTFTGMSAANPGKAIEKMSPYEVAETSAVGRALGFAGFGLVEGIATADEMVKASTGSSMAHEGFPDEPVITKCPECGATGKYHKPGCSRKL